MRQLQRGATGGRNTEQRPEGVSGKDNLAFGVPGAAAPLRCIA